MQAFSIANSSVLHLDGIEITVFLPRAFDYLYELNSLNSLNEASKKFNKGFIEFDAIYQLLAFKMFNLCLDALIL